jgi:DNA-binding transcriptional MerR regulator
MPLTVSEIAERIAKPGASKAALIERIRHWTRERLISPIGKRSPGTGRHRVYDESVLEDAVVLNAMADMGLQVGLQRTVLKLVRHEKTAWREKAKRGVSLFLEIDTLPDGQRFPHLHEGAWVSPDAEHAIVFNLTRLFAGLSLERE